jgi:hypothetical protein
MRLGIRELWPSPWNPALNGADTTACIVIAFA